MKETIIYIRTSTEEQNPENQLKDCLSINQYGEYELIEDKVSGWKDIEREGFERLNKAIRNKEARHLIVWDLDRLYRNRKKLIAFFELCKMFDCKIHSFRQQWLESLNKIPEPFNEIMHSLMLQVMGWLSQEESDKKSQRVRIAVRREEGITKSYKGNKWGRKAVFNSRIIGDIQRLKAEGKSIREISKEVCYYDKNNNKKFVSPSLVHKLLKQSST